MYIARSLGAFRVTGGQARASGIFHIRPKMQIHFFDRSIIRTRWPKFNSDPLQKAGNLIMRIARGSIKRRKDLRGKPSPAGQPPRSRQPGHTPPFKQIFSVPFRLGTSVIVGMVGYGGTPPVPGLHEHGGVAQRFVYRRQPQRRSKRTGQYLKKRISYKKEMVKYPQRAFMEPALLRAISLGRIPYFWQASITKAAA